MYFTEREVLRLFNGICGAVKAFHTAQPHPLAHRDLKPANVLLDDRHNPVIMDLGNNNDGYFLKTVKTAILYY